MLTAFCCSHPVSFSVFGDADGRYSKYSSWSLKISAYKLPSKIAVENTGAFAKQVRNLFLHHSEARGPCYARARIQQELFQAG